MVEDAFRLIKVRNAPGKAGDEPVTHVKVRIAIIQIRIEWIQISEVEVIAAAAEGRAEIISRHRVCVPCGKAKTPVAQVAAVYRRDNRIVSRPAVASSEVDRGGACVVQSRAQTRDAEIEEARQSAIDVRD